MEETIEYQDYKNNQGWSLVNVVVIIALISAIIQTFGILKQNKKIWKNKSSKALPLNYFIFQFFYYSAYFIYGIKIHSGSLIINNLVGIFFIPIIVGIVKFKRKRGESFKNELLLFPLLLSTIPCVIFIKMELSLIIILIIAAIVFTDLVIIFFKDKTTENIDQKFIISIFLGSLIWASYGFKINDFGLTISSSLTLIISLGIITYLIFKKRESISPES